MSARKLVPYVLAGVGVGLCLLVIASAGLVAYDRATRPAPREVAAQDVPAEKDADAPAGAAASTDEAPAPEPEPTPEPEPAPAASHYYECDYFYVDVPDSWQQETTAEQSGDGEWRFYHHDGQYLYMTIILTSPEPQSGPDHHWLVGSTSDSTQIWANDAATGFFGEGKASITLK